MTGGHGEQGASFTARVQDFSEPLRSKLAHRLETQFKYCFMHTVSYLEERAGYIHNARRAGNESVSQRFQSPPTADPALFKIAVLLTSDLSAELN